MNSNFLHYIVTESCDLARDRDGAGAQTQTQPAVSGLPTCIHLSLRSHYTHTQTDQFLQNDNELKSDCRVITQYVHTSCYDTAIQEKHTQSTGTDF